MPFVNANIRVFRIGPVSSAKGSHDQPPGQGEPVLWPRPCIGPQAAKRAQQPCVNRLEVRALLAYFQGLGANTTATDVSANGSVVVGNVTNQGPFYWTQGNGFVLLRDSSGNILGDLYKATSVSGDGSVIVGGSPTPGFAFAFRWANGVAALIPQLKGIVSTANSVST